MAAREEVVIDGDSTEEDDEVRILTPQSRKRRRRSHLLVDDEDQDQEEDVEAQEETQEKEPRNGRKRQQQLRLSRDGVSTQPMKLQTPVSTRQPRRNMQQLSISAAVARGERGRRLQAEKQSENEDDDEDSEDEQEASQEETDDDEKQDTRPHYNEGDEDYEDYEEESEPEDSPLPPARKRKSLPREGERDHREKVYADGGDDLDEFIVGDDEVEFMDDDEEGVISVETSDDEMEGDPHEELAAMMEARRSREMSEWFAIYLEYLEECIVDPDMENKMYRSRSKPKYQLYDQAIHHIERQICARRDSLRVNVAWPEEMVDALKHASQFRSSQVSAEQDCDACKRSQHVATYHVEFGGISCDANELLKKSVRKASPVRASFEMGSVCHGRTLAYWQLLHAKQFFCILVDAKRKECGDSTGRIAKAHRKGFFKLEYGRYKRMVSLVEKFADDSKRFSIKMPNVWKVITPRHMTSDFLPAPSRPSFFSDPEPESRRGAMDAFVADSEEERSGDEDEESMMEEMENNKQITTSENNEDEQVTDDEETKAEEVIEIVSRLTPRLESKKEKKLRLAATEKEETQTREKEEAKTKVEPQEKKEHQEKEEQPASDLDIDDLKCLVCDVSPRNAGVIHGMYLHVYCCYGCAKRQHHAKVGCSVCNRPIDRVLRLLPLSKAAREAIKKQGQKQGQKQGHS
ncbi:hypothetical protein JM18_000455 [Phytophthora kernoviae]|uniref:DUF4211 domain-containing protein n=2 Tax=Phytophthora kernoviae TaxID=325452 RepID=A0A921VFI6_9STRA|nr:hypothetical protein G195_002832 [Phytophthora kernoviae 00238/432]KAG2532541.1 hypothetical protein JM18_000455 [Phytophthora kernoviae]